MKLTIHCEIEDPEVIGAIFGLLGKSPTNLNLRIDGEPEADTIPTLHINREDHTATETPAEPPARRDAIAPPAPAEELETPPDATPAEEPKRGRGRPKKGEQQHLPAGPVDQVMFAAAVRSCRERWGVEAARSVMRGVAGVEKPQDVPADKWSAVVDACNAYTGAGLDMGEFL